MAVAVLTGLPEAAGDHAIVQTFDSLKLETEPITANVASTFFRLINNELSAWIVHVDSWNYADPEKIIELAPIRASGQ